MSPVPLGLDERDVWTNEGKVRSRDLDDIERLCSILSWNSAFWLRDGDPKRRKFIEVWKRKYGHSNEVEVKSNLNCSSKCQLNNISDQTKQSEVDEKNKEFKSVD